MFIGNEKLSRIKPTSLFYLKEEYADDVCVKYFIFISFINGNLRSYDFYDNGVCSFCCSEFDDDLLKYYHVQES